MRLRANENRLAASDRPFDTTMVDGSRCSIWCARCKIRMPGLYCEFCGRIRNEAFGLFSDEEEEPDNPNQRRRGTIARKRVSEARHNLVDYRVVRLPLLR